MNIVPFSAIIGQEQIKLALILNAVNPSAGGLLIRGEKGTGKSTAVRSLARLLPEIEIIRGCRYGCSPAAGSLVCTECSRLLESGEAPRTEYRRSRVIDLPLNATEEMLTGTIDLKHAVQRGIRSFQPGLFAEAHRGFLYIDEVNLLADHLSDIILDTAASGINTVEREGVSIRHPSRFILVGSMNPEEGELRPQFLDRFGMCVDVRGIQDPGERVRLMELREQFDSDPESTRAAYASEEEDLKKRIENARKLLPEVRVSRDQLRFIAQLCLENNVKGHRADLVIRQGAAAYAAYQGRTEVILRDVQTAARFALLHRSNIAAECDHHGEHEEIETVQSESDGNTAESREEIRKTSVLTGTEEENEQFPSMKNEQSKDNGNREKIIVDRQDVYEIGEIFPIRNFPVLNSRRNARGRGKRNKASNTVREGRYVRSRPARELKDIAFDATIRAAAPYQLRRKGESDLACIIHPQDVYEKVREKKIGNLFLFILDASGSMGAHQRMVATKGAVFSLLMDAYQKRDKTAMVTFQKREADCILPPTSSIDLAGKLLKDLAVGGRTPLSKGLLKGYSVLHNYLIKEPDASPVVVIITDGKANIPLEGKQDPYLEALSIAGMMARHPLVQYILVDTLEPRQANLGTAVRLAEALGAEYFKIEDLKTSDLVDIARSMRQ